MPAAASASSRATVPAVGTIRSISGTSNGSPRDPLGPGALDFWLGDWSVTTPDGKHAGDNRIEAILDGCALSESWTGAGGGRGRGAVHHLAPAEEVPPGVVLVVPHLDPRLAPVIPRLAGLIAETGNPLSHLAILAREHRVPVVVGFAGASEALAAGDVVELVGADGEAFARGMAAAGAEEIAARPRGLEAVHRDRLVIY